jgi:hypothetical protein
VLKEITLNVATIGDFLVLAICSVFEMNSIGKGSIIGKMIKGGDFLRRILLSILYKKYDVKMNFNFNDLGKEERD